MDLSRLTNAVAPCKHYFTGTSFFKKSMNLDFTPPTVCPFVFQFNGLDLIFEYAKEYSKGDMWFITEDRDFLQSTYTNENFLKLINKFISQVSLMGANNLNPRMSLRLLRLGTIKLRKVLDIAFKQDIHNPEWYFRKLGEVVTDNLNMQTFEKTAQLLARVDRLGWRPEFHIFYDRWTVLAIRTILLMAAWNWQADQPHHPGAHFHKLPLELLFKIFGYIAVLK